jgi:acyl-CoA synthetase
VTVGRLAVEPDAARVYRAEGWWGDDTVGSCVARHATVRPGAPAFVEPDQRLSWLEYERRSTALAGLFAAVGIAPGSRVAVMLPDTATVHVTYVACEKAGATVVGLGSRAGNREVRHVLAETGATALVTAASLRGRDTAARVADLRRDVGLARVVIVPNLAAPTLSEIEIDGEATPLPEPDRATAAVTGHGLGPDDVFMLNSTSGTTGLPKVVVHHENRWFAFHRLAVAAGALTADDVFLSAIPAPFGFGLWTAHFTPGILGAPCVLLDHFDPATLLELIERERVSVLCCVSTQFMMMLEDPMLSTRDLSSLRCMFTGGEAVPYERAAAFEEATGAAVLQFFGSNETGALSRTTLDDDREHRLRTAGRVIPEMHVRLYDESGRVVLGQSGRGRPAGRGPITCLGYLDRDANRDLYTPDGWMLMGDLVEIDDEGYVRVIGRTSDFIIRGGKNISAPAVEAEVATHPAVALAAAVGMPDPRFGERVCVYVELRAGHTLSLDELTSHLDRRGVSKEWFPERLVVLDALPRSSGGKVAKGDLAADIRRRQAEETATGSD